MEGEREYQVYIHVNKINNKKYIGITNQEPERRWRKNGEGYKAQKHFYNAIKKYGWDNFEHKILFTNLTLEEANAIEKCYIKNMDLMNRNKGYNDKEGGDCAKPSDDLRKKLSETHKGFKVSEATKEKLREINKQRIGNKNPMYGKGKKIICLETGEIFNSARIASDKLNIDASSIIAVCKNRRFTAGDLHFMYLEEYDKNKKYNLTSFKRKIICINTGEIFNSIQDAKNKLNIHSGHISEVCQGKLAHIKGYVFKYYIDK